MADTNISLVKALQTYFSAEPFGRKIEIAEFKALTANDKADLRNLLADVGIECAALPNS